MNKLCFPCKLVAKIVKMSDALKRYVPASYLKSAIDNSNSFENVKRTLLEQVRLNIFHPNYSFSRNYRMRFIFCFSEKYLILAGAIMLLRVLFDICHLWTATTLLINVVWANVKPESHVVSTKNLQPIP